MTQSQIIDLIILIAPTLLSILFGMKWWKEKTGKTGAVIEAAATAAVTALNRNVVDLDRANPDTGAGVGKVSPGVAKAAKREAMITAVEGVIAAINPAAGQIAAQIAPAIDIAIEKAVEAAKPKAPESVVALFPDSDKDTTK